MSWPEDRREGMDDERDEAPEPELEITAEDERQAIHHLDAIVWPAEGLTRDEIKRKYRNLPKGSTCGYPPANATTRPLRSFMTPRSRRAAPRATSSARIPISRRPSRSRTVALQPGVARRSSISTASRMAAALKIVILRRKASSG